jgi:hypothetical protein
LLGSFLELKNGIPSHDTIRMIPLDAFSACSTPAPSKRDLPSGSATRVSTQVGTSSL